MHIQLNTDLSLARSLPSCLDIPAASTTATKPHLEEPGEDCERRSHPHAREHDFADTGLDVDILVILEDVAHDDEHDGGNNAGGGDEQGVEEGDDGEGEGDPAAECGERHEEDEDEGDDGAGEEEAEHPVGG